MVEGRSKQAFTTWLAGRTQAWRNAVEAVAIDGFTGLKTANTHELSDAVAVRDPFYVVRLGEDALDRGRRRVQQAIHGHYGRKGDPLYAARRTLHTGPRPTHREAGRPLEHPVHQRNGHIEVEATWGIDSG